MWYCNYNNWVFCEKMEVYHSHLCLKNFLQFPCSQWLLSYLLKLSSGLLTYLQPVIVLWSKRQCNQLLADTTVQVCFSWNNKNIFCMWCVPYGHNEYYTENQYRTECPLDDYILLLIFLGQFFLRRPQLSFALQFLSHCSIKLAAEYWFAIESIFKVEH